MATNHSREIDCELEIACRRDGTILGLRGHIYRRHGRLYPHQWRRRAGQGRAIPARALSHSATSVRGRSLHDQQDAGRHLPRAGALRGEFLSRAADRHGGARSRHRPGRIPPQEPDHRSRAALFASASSCPTRRRPPTTPATIMPPSTVPGGIRLGREEDRCKAARSTAAITGSASRAFVESGGAGPRENVAHDAGARRHDHHRASARRCSARGWRPYSRRSPPTRWSCRSNTFRVLHGSTTSAR